MAGGIELQFDTVSFTLIALVIATAVIPIVLSKDPDIHPFALLRQSSVAAFVLRSMGLFMAHCTYHTHVSPVVSEIPKNPPSTGLYRRLRATHW